MPHADDIVHRLRRCLARYDGRAPEDAAALAEEYARAVEEVNARLHRCLTLLRQGHRGDAIYQAELAPPVAEEAAALDFPDRPRWVELCREHELATAATVDADAVAELNEAYNQEQAVEPLLRAHRRLAIGRGPLAARIRVLNNLVRADPTNPIWREDLAAYEKARHKEIEHAAQQAHQRGDLAVLGRLHEEVHRDTWAQPPSQVLRRYVDRLYLNLRDRDARQRLATLCDSIEKAHAEGELHRTAGLLDDWQRTLTALAGEAPATPEAVLAASEWVEAQHAEAEQAEAYRRACSVLEAALDEDESMASLERQWAALTRFERPIPRLLANRYRARLAEHRLETRRRFQLMLTGSLAALLLLGTGVGWLIYRSVDARHADQWEQQITAHIEASRFDDAEQLLERLNAEHPEVHARPTFQALAMQVADELESDAVRRERFELAMDRAERAPMEEPDEQALAEARELASTDEERLRVERLTAEIERAEARAQEARDAAYTEKLEAFRRRFARTGGLAMEPEAVRDELVSLSAELAEALDAEVSPPLLAASRSLLDTINNEIETYDRRIAAERRRVRQLGSIRGSYAEPGQLEQMLRTFAAEFPDDDHAGDFAEAAGFAGYAAELDAIHEALVELRPLRVATLERAESQLERVAALVESAGEANPYAEPLEHYRAYLEQAVASLDPANRPGRESGPLDRLLAHRLVDDVLMVTDEAGRRFYFPADFAPEVPDDPDRAFTLRYIGKPDQTFSTDALETMAVSARELVEPEPVLSPQSAFARRAREMLEAGEAEWEHRCVSVAAEAAEDEAIDPLLRVMLLAELLPLAERWDWRAPELDAWLGEAQRLIERDANWIAPEDTSADSDRAEAEELLAALPDLSAQAEATEAWAEALAGELQPREPVGIVWAADAGEPEAEAMEGADDEEEEQEAEVERFVAGSALDGRSGTLEVLRRGASGEGALRFTAVAEADDGEVRWRRPIEQLPRGLVVYLRE